MAELLRVAWAKQPSRVWLHTCTLDHPNALPFYLGRGFQAYNRTFGAYNDSRLSGCLVKVSDARIPVIHPDSGDAPD
jgi:hypothetical protein